MECIYQQGKRTSLFLMRLGLHLAGPARFERAIYALRGNCIK